MGSRKLPGWLILAAIAVGVLGNAGIVVLIFQMEGLAFGITLLIYAIVMSAICAWLLRRRELRSLSAELQISEEEVLEKIRLAKQRKRKT